MQKIFISSILGLLITSCSVNPSFKSKESEYFSYYESRCGSCHEPIEAEKYYSYQWKRLLILLEKGIELEHQDLQPPLSSEEAKQLSKYLTYYARINPVNIK